MSGMGLKRKLILGFIGIILLLGLAVVVFIRENLSQRLVAELQDKGLSIARNLAADSIDFILIDDLVSLKRLVENVKEMEKDVDYVFILSPEKEVLAQTFGGGFPRDLLEANSLEPGQAKRIQILKAERGLISEIAVPILKGNLGSVHVGLSEERIRRAVATHVWTLMAITVGILILGGFVTYLLANRIVNPILEITEAVKAVGEGNLRQRVGVSSKDELGTLAFTFNLMANKLQKAEEDLQESQDQLLQAEKLASVGRLAAGIAHDINNPLGGILNCIRSLLEESDLRGKKRQYLELVLKGLLQIGDIVKQLLSFSGQHPFRLELTDLNEAVREALALAQYRSSSQRVEIQEELATNLPKLFVDRSQLGQVFLNLIINALDAMPNGGKLQIRTAVDQKEGENVFIEFTDTGCGIAKESLPKVFDPFYTTKTDKGVGLGLSLSQGIIKRHRGTITIRSKREEGTTVIIKLPVEMKEKSPVEAIANGG